MSSEISNPKTDRKTLDFKIIPPSQQRPKPTFKVHLPWTQGEQKPKAIPRTGDPRKAKKTSRPGRRSRKPKSKKPSSGAFLSLPVNNSDLPKDIERDNSFMISADDPKLHQIFGDFREISPRSTPVESGKATSP
ncbi:hypothetical protein AAMO2058_001663200 [Amorphochlora amoebiformis]|uniref:Uncharacterized protein n=1 Tax=Amorphochlora amoebiformis TaxID=1561963 RepID=A0A7S0H2U5_9EUKA|mmetsp:Transcript_5918/g.9086  ORF Transcript_5918/g.9086 Transcript_5918/m.9086 type:complete len:134 (+) Transcript_5918:60-461(+)